MRKNSSQSIDSKFSSASPKSSRRMPPLPPVATLAGRPPRRSAHSRMVSWSRVWLVMVGPPSGANDDAAARFPSQGGEMRVQIVQPVLTPEPLVGFGQDVEGNAEGTAVHRLLE